MTADDAGATLTAVLTATAEGYTDGTATSNPVAGLDRGIHVITVRYEGTGQLDGDRSLPRIVFVW